MEEATQENIFRIFSFTIQQKIRASTAATMP
jgi:hypothetical protein